MSVQNYLAGFAGIFAMIYLVGFIFTLTISIRDGLIRGRNKRTSKYMALMAFFIVSAVWPIAWIAVIISFTIKQKSEEK